MKAGKRLKVLLIIYMKNNMKHLVLTSSCSIPLWLRYNSSNAVHADKPSIDVSLLLCNDSLRKLNKFSSPEMRVMRLRPSHSSCRFPRESMPSMVRMRLLPSSKISREVSCETPSSVATLFCATYNSLRRGALSSINGAMLRISL